MDEFARIRYWTDQRQSAEWQASRGVVAGIGDDAAVVDLAKGASALPGKKQLVLAVDTMVETVHFNAATMRDEDIGYKALAANVSDIAAMGALPLHALVAVSVPASFGFERMARVYDGLYECAAEHGIAVIGGDTTSSPAHLVITVTLTGEVEAGAALRRSGARSGDAVFVTGPVGMSAAGLHMLLHDGAGSGAAEESYAEPLARAHRRPSPSVRAGRLLMERGSCRALNDVSDGLASEAWEIAEASGVRLTIYEHLLPRSGSMAAYAARTGADSLEWMLYGGEDYVLLGTMARDDAEAAKAAFREEGLPFYIIGEAEEGAPGVELAAGRGTGGIRRALDKRGYNHFK